MSLCLYCDLTFEEHVSADLCPSCHLLYTVKLVQDVRGGLLTWLTVPSNEDAIKLLFSRPEKVRRGG